MTKESTIERYERELVDGTTLRRIAASQRSVPLGGPPIASRNWADIIVALGRFAQMNDWAADVAAKAIRATNQYVTTAEVLAKIADVLADAVREGWYDVRSATGPEASRPSAHQKPTTMRQAILLNLLMVEIQMNAGYTGSVPGVGWALRGLVEKDKVIVPRAYLPKTVAELN